MDIATYQKEASRTDLRSYTPVANKFNSAFMCSLMHASLGMTTESAEFADALKKHFMYGKAFDPVNLAEELGDMMWYIALAANTLGVSLESVMQTNIGKLRARYPDKFTEHAALNRDLETERKILEGQ